MAVTNIANLDGLDPVANVAAGGEIIIKDCVKKALSKLAQGDPRVLDLFVGQMAAEGFTADIGIKYTVESPTVRIVIKKQATPQFQILTYVLASAVWVLVGRRTQVVQ